MKNATNPLAVARQAAQAAAAARSAAEPSVETFDGDEAVCFVQLAVACYLDGFVVGMGAMPDGSALWIRLRCPASSENARAGMVAFVVSDDTLGLLQKAVSALEASPDSKWWKVDQFAAQKDTRPA